MGVSHFGRPPVFPRSGAARENRVFRSALKAGYEQRGSEAALRRRRLRLRRPY